MDEKQNERTLYIIYAPLLCCMALIVAFSGSVSRAALNSIIMCGKALIPSIFPYLVISGILIKTGFAEFFGEKTGKFISRIIGIDKNSAAAVVTGLICGFPSGAACASGIMKNGGISENEAKSLIPMCSMASPGFTVYAIGINMLGSYKRGIFLYALQALISLAVGSIFFGRRNNKNYCTLRSSSHEKAGFLEAFSSSLTEAIGSMISICGTVIFFSVISGIISSVDILPQAVKTVSAAILEISSGCAAICTSLTANAAFVAVSATIGWTGLSVFIQTASVTEKKMSYKKYLTEKCVCSVCCAAAAYVSVKLGII